MKILFIGGTGVISSACAEWCIANGHELVLLHRGKSFRAVPEGAKSLIADINQPDAVADKLGNHTFDVIVDWIAFAPADVDRDIRLFRDRTAQYVFISSASAYQKPLKQLPITEETPLENPFWEYSQKKIACEKRLFREHRETGFPVTIVRPSHTYDRTMIPLRGGGTALQRLLSGIPVIVQGDGTSLWTLTHHRDFAKGFGGVLGENSAIGEAFHITSDEWLTWDRITELMAEAAGVTPKLLHVPSHILEREIPEWQGSLLGDKAHSAIFDNSKIKRLVPDFSADIPFSEGAKEIVEWHTADPARLTVDPQLDQKMDELVARFS